MSYRGSRLHKSREAFLEGISVPLPRPFAPDPFQLEAIEYLENGDDVLVIAPTGAGKTYIATQAIEATARKGGRSIYTAPLKALSNAKYSEFKRRFEPEFSVGLLTGDRKIDPESDVVVATTEIYRNDLYSLRGDYSLVVLDEFHYLADPQRGAVWEESIILSTRSSRLLLLSASISNAEVIAAWMKEVRNKEVRIVTVPKRPVELRIGYLHPDYGAIPLSDGENNLNEAVASFYYQRQNEHGPRRERGGRGERSGSSRRRKR
ncbi:MAG: DEAD/DEAH box helicase [bacterium]|nr:DEAD/DEAH box helicase [bacterium]